MSVITWNRDQPRARSAINIQQGVLIMLFGAIFLLRFSTEPFNTVFYDEAVNATLGREVLYGDFSQNGTTWTFGSYLYPFVAGAANELGGEIGLRLLSATLNTISTIFVFLTVQKLFNMNIALWSLALFGLAGGSISLGQLAVYDSLGLPLTAAALYCIVRSAFVKGKVRYAWLVAAGVAFSCSVLSKYIGALFFPALLLSGVMIYLSREDFSSILPLFTVFALVVGLIVGTYVLLNFDALLHLMGNRNTLLFVASTRAKIIETFIVESGVVLPLGLLGLFFARSLPFYRKDRQTREKSILLLLMIPAFFVCTFAAQIYQVYSENIQSLWKHTVYTAVFLTPLAGFAITHVIQISREMEEKQHHNPRTSFIYRGVVALGIFIMLSWFVEYGLGRNWGFQHSWPDVRNVVNYLRTQDISLDTRVLAEQSAVYEYYFDFGPNDRDVWSNTFYMEYRGFQGEEAMLEGIRDHYFDFVILDDYYTPAINPNLEATLLEAGYHISYREPEPQELSTAQITSARVYSLE